MRSWELGIVKGSRHEKDNVRHGHENEDGLMDIIKLGLTIWVIHSKPIEKVNSLAIAENSGRKVLG